MNWCPPILVDTSCLSALIGKRCREIRAYGTLAENLGFSPIKLGGLSEGGLLVQARGNSWGRLIFKDLVKFDG